MKIHFITPLKRPFFSYKQTNEKKHLNFSTTNITPLKTDTISFKSSNNIMNKNDTKVYMDAYLESIQNNSISDKLLFDNFHKILSKEEKNNLYSQQDKYTKDNILNYLILTERLKLTKAIFEDNEITQNTKNSMLLNKNNEGFTPLYLAFKENNIDFLKFIINNSPVDILMQTLSEKAGNEDSLYSIAKTWNNTTNDKSYEKSVTLITDTIDTLENIYTLEEIKRILNYGNLKEKTNILTSKGFHGISAFDKCLQEYDLNTAFDICAELKKMEFSDLRAELLKEIEENHYYTLGLNIMGWEKLIDFLKQEEIYEKK